MCQSVEFPFYGMLSILFGVMRCYPKLKDSLEKCKVSCSPPMPEIWVVGSVPLPHDWTVNCKACLLGIGQVPDITALVNSFSHVSFSAIRAFPPSTALPGMSLVFFWTVEACMCAFSAGERESRGVQHEVSHDVVHCYTGGP